jgi:hypothetical protein
MREILWLLAGVAVGVLHGWSVTWSVGSLRPGRKGQARIAVLVGSLLRTAGTIVGFVVSRTVYTAIAASRMAHPDGSRNEGG